MGRRLTCWTVLVLNLGPGGGRYNSKPVALLVNSVQVLGVEKF